MKYKRFNLLQHFFTYYDNSIQDVRIVTVHAIRVMDKYIYWAVANMFQFCQQYNSNAPLSVYNHFQFTQAIKCGSVSDYLLLCRVKQSELSL